MLVSEFLVNLKRRGQYQAAQTVLSDADYIAFANDQMKMVICPKILSVRDNYFMTQVDYTLTGKRRYRLPPRILGSRISKIVILDGNAQYLLPQVANTAKPDSYIRGFYMTEGDIVLVGTIPSGAMRVTYPIRPPKMSTTAVSSGWTIVDPAPSPMTITDTMMGLTSRQVIRPQTPNRTVGLCLTSGAGCVPITTDHELFQIGDLILTTPDQTYLVPLEDELIDWLAQRTHMRILQALGQTNELAAAGSKLADMEKDYLALITPRVENSPKTIQGGDLMGWVE